MEEVQCVAKRNLQAYPSMKVHRTLAAVALATRLILTTHVLAIDSLAVESKALRAPSEYLVLSERTAFYWRSAMYCGVLSEGHRHQELHPANDSLSQNRT